MLFLATAQKASLSGTWVCLCCDLIYTERPFSFFSIVVFQHFLPLPNIAVFKLPELYGASATVFLAAQFPLSLEFFYSFLLTSITDVWQLAQYAAALGFYLLFMIALLPHLFYSCNDLDGQTFHFSSCTLLQNLLHFCTYISFSPV